MPRIYYRQIYRQKYLLELRRNMRVKVRITRQLKELTIPQSADNY
jgi:hypothetical protein